MSDQQQTSGGMMDNGVVKWIEHRLPVFSFLDHSLGSQYPTPKNLNYWWNFGSLAGVALVVMIVTGIVLVMHYTPHVDHAFASIERIMRDVNGGWLIRYIHMNMASFFFVAVFIHIFRGLYFGSYKYPRELLWIIGVLILLAMMATAFMGYVLPWGQMSYWGATVITNLFSAVPVVGDMIVSLLWGGFIVDNPTLNRFFSLHYLMPFVILGLVIVHIWALHMFGSNNPTGVDVKNKDQDTIGFHPYFTIKDLFGMGVFLLIFCFFLFYAPNYFGHPDNYIEADPLATPPHIVPEWYFLPFYAILRAFTNDFILYWPISWLMTAKLAGVVAMFGSVILLALVPWLDTSRVRSATYRPIYKWFFWLFVLDWLVLGLVGAKPPEGAWVLIGQIATTYYFAHLLVILPILGVIERPLPTPESISASVTQPAE